MCDTNEREKGYSIQETKKDICEQTRKRERKIYVRQGGGVRQGELLYAHIEGI